jgi:hypothetical protein
MAKRGPNEKTVRVGKEKAKVPRSLSDPDYCEA